jgi:O-antigen/teichoic acid export membrane protein
MSSVAKKSSILMVTRVLTAISTFLGGLILARSLTQNEYATYSQVMLLGSTFSVLTVGLQQSLFYFLPKAVEIKKKEIVVRTMSVAVQILLLPLVLLFCFRFQLSSLFNNEELLVILSPILLYVMFFSLSEFLDAVLISYDRLLSLAFLKVGVAVVIFTMILFGVGFDLGLEFIVLSVACCYSCLVLYAICFTLNQKGGGLVLSFLSTGMMKCQLSYALPITMSSLVLILGKRMDQYLVVSLFPTEKYAIYARGATEIPFVDIITISVFTILVPEFVRLTEQGAVNEIYQLWCKVVRNIALLFFPVAFYFSIMAEPFIVFLFSEKYSDSSEVFCVYSISLVLRIAIYGSIPRAVGKTRSIYIMSLMSVVLNVLFSYPLILRFGPVGAAVGTLLAQIITVIYALAVNASLLNKKFAEIFPWRDLLYISIAVMCSGLPLVFVLSSGLSELFKLLLGFVLFSSVLLLIYFKFGLISIAELAIIIKRYTTLNSKRRKC